MPDFVRVKLDNGAEVSVSADYAEHHKLKTLDQPASDGRGRALPDKPPEEKSRSAASSSSKEDTK